MEIFSDEDEDFSSPEEGSDSEPMLDDQVSHTRRLMSGRKARGLGAGKSNAAAARQRNLKQKFVSLLKKFKVTDPEELDQEQANLDQKISGKYRAYMLFGRLFPKAVIAFSYKKAFKSPLQSTIPEKFSSVREKTEI